MAPSKKIPIHFLENFIVLGVWLVIFALPAIILREYDYIVWTKVIRAWERIFPFFLLFLVNHYVLIPFLLFKNKKLLFFSIVVALMTLLFTNDYLKFKADEKQRMALNERRPLPGNRPQRMPLLQQPGELPPPHEQRPNAEQGPRQHPANIPPYLNSIFFTLFIIGFDTGLRTSLKWTEAEKQKSNLEKENVENKLAFLKHQVSPHFFMNTLNNIHSLIDIDSEEAKESIIKLSKLMRYLLYDTGGGTVLIKKEVEFIQSYVNLMKLRFSEKVKIDLQIHEPVPEKNIHPMLFISLIENAFKHGISYQEESFVNIKMLFTEQSLLFEIKNSKPKNKEVIDSSGIGMENTKNRLDLLYGSSYLMNIQDDDAAFGVNLTIPL